MTLASNLLCGFFPFAEFFGDVAKFVGFVRMFRAVVFMCVVCPVHVSLPQHAQWKNLNLAALAFFLTALILLGCLCR